MPLLITSPVSWARLTIGRVDRTLRPWGSIGGTCPLSVARSQWRRFGRSLRCCPWIRLLDQTGSRVAFITLLSQSSKGISSGILMLSPLWIATPFTTSNTPYSFSCPSRTIRCLWATTALLTSSTALGFFPKRLLTTLLWCCLF
jgi:hypothetical protein